jgi:hypothetical protein
LRLPVAALAAVAAGLSLRRRAPTPTGADATIAEADLGATPAAEPRGDRAGQADASQEVLEGAPTAAKPSLRRELHAIGVLYVALMVLPGLVGVMFGP